MFILSHNAHESRYYSHQCRNIYTKPQHKDCSTRKLYIYIYKCHQVNENNSPIPLYCSWRSIIIYYTILCDGGTHTNTHKSYKSVPHPSKTAVLLKQRHFSTKVSTSECGGLKCGKPFISQSGMTLKPFTLQENFWRRPGSALGGGKDLSTG